MDAIQIVVDIATKARRETGKRKGFCALIITKIHNAFNTTRSENCIVAMMRKKASASSNRCDYLLQITYERVTWSLQEEMTCGAPQGSRVGPLVWNVMCDYFLRMGLPAGTSIIGYADDALIFCAADDVKILELRINDSLWRAKR